MDDPSRVSPASSPRFQVAPPKPLWYRTGALREVMPRAQNPVTDGRAGCVDRT